MHMISILARNETKERDFHPLMYDIHTQCMKFSVIIILRNHEVLVEVWFSHLT